MVLNMTGVDADLADIQNRNRLRAECGLPLLSVDAELARIVRFREQAEFEREFERRRSELCHQWTGNRDGWLINMGRWSLARTASSARNAKGPHPLIYLFFSH
jgi:hypothetical protein